MLANCTANSKFNPNSNKRIGEKEVKNAVIRVKNTLEEEYEDLLRKLNLSITIQNLHYREWYKFLTAVEGSSPENFYFDLNRGFKPDGSFLCLYDKNMDTPYVLLSSEAKTQGTNKGRVSKGKIKQSVGNAIERSSKNLGLMNFFFKKLPFNPYAIFMSGCDFDPENKYMQNKVLEINMGYSLNEILLNQGVGTTGCSIFCREMPYSIEEIEHILYKIAKNSMEYYLHTYFKK